jgi:hypothetical protein
LGLWSDNKTFAKNPYSAELNAEWPKIWQADKHLVQDRIKVLVSKDESTTVGIPIYKGGYRDDIDKYDYTYWLDFLEGSQGGTQNMSQFNINSIGRRTKVVNEKNVNCLFAREFPNYIYIEASKGISREEQRVTNQMGREAIQVSSDVYKNLSTGGNQNSAFDKIRELLYTYTQYNDSISLSVIPIYHLEPNTRISVQDRETGVNGDYLIKSISLPLTTNGTSSISATRCLERSF